MGACLGDGYVPIGGGTVVGGCAEGRNTFAGVNGTWPEPDAGGPDSKCAGPVTTGAWVCGACDRGGIASGAVPDLCERGGTVACGARASAGIGAMGGGSSTVSMTNGTLPAMVAWAED